MAEKPFLSALAVLVTMASIQFSFKLIRNRRYFRALRARGLPMPPHSFLFGHLPVLVSTTKLLPSDAHALHLSTFIRKTYPELGPDFYLDLWPLAPSMLVVGSPETLHQVSVQHVMGKNDLLRNFLLPLTNGLDMVSMNGAPWKRWRAVFNPGFSAAHLTTLISFIIRETEIYCERLDEHVVKQDIFEMKSLTDNLILDVIGQVVLKVSLNSQRSFNQVVYSLRKQIKWMTTGADINLLNRYNPMRPFVQWYHSRKVNEYVTEELDKRINEWQDTTSDSKNTRTITDLTLNAYTESQGNDRKAVNDPYFKQICLAQVKIFLFAGHDTTSSGICFNFWTLSQNPDVLARLCKEHDKVFGSDPSIAADSIIQSPHLINQLPYTTAIIKETLRLFPPVTSTRGGEVGIDLVDSEGRIYPTVNMVVWHNSHSTHRDPAYWTKAESFIPDRWLVGPEDPLYPTKGMWRPFEQGPRNCLGQELAMLEMKIVLVLVSRKYTIKPAYDELDIKSGRKQTTVLGAKAYQVDIMQPRGNLPVRVERTEKL